mgnify:CR=1 FL=1
MARKRKYRKGECTMIKLYKTAEKNEKIKAVIADLRKTSRPFSFKYYCMDERISWVMSTMIWNPGKWQEKLHGS